MRRSLPGCLSLAIGAICLWSFGAGRVFPADYSWAEFTIPSFGFGTSEVFVPDSDPIERIALEVSACTSDLNPTAMYVISPADTIVALYEKYDIEEMCLFETLFDDSADRSILRSIAPYIGPHRPKEELANFNGEWSDGTWTLVAYNDDPTQSLVVYPSTLYINEPTPPTPTPTPTDLHCVYYQGNPASGVGVMGLSSQILMPDQGYIDDIDVRISASASSDLASTGMYLVSPDGVSRPLYEKEDLEQHELYQTVFDDEAGISIEQGIVPYLGPHQPRGTLSSFDGKWCAGLWTLVIYNDSAQDLDVSEWGIRYCIRGALVPTRTPTPISLTSPTPSRTPTPPPGFTSPTPPPSPSPTSSITPSPTPLLDCTDYPGSFMSWTTVATKISYRQVFTNNEITDVKVRVTAQVATSLDSLGMYLMSPEGTLVSLFEKHQLAEHQLYWTWFDDSAWNGITSGVSPYIGSYRPVEPLRAFRGEFTEGTWVLIAYNDSANNAGQVTDWILELCTAPFGTPTPSPVPPIPPPGNMMPIIANGDYNGDGTSDIGFFRPATGLWSIRDVGTDFFGSNGDTPVSGDYDGDGTADIGVWRPSQILWNVRAVTRYYFGAAGDIPAPGDYDGDGACDPAIFRPSAGFWFSPGLTRFIFGAVGDIPVPADYDNDGVTDIGIFRPSSALWSVRGLTRAYFGASTDFPVPAGYSGGGARISIFRQSGGLWVMQGLSRFSFGSSADLPVPADYRGDGFDLPAIFRSSTGLWSARDFTRVFWGGAGDVPVTR